MPNTSGLVRTAKRGGSALTRSFVMVLVVAVAAAGSVFAARYLPGALSGERTIAIAASEAAWTSAEHPNTVQSSDSRLRASETSERSYLRFDLDQLAGRRVVAAELVLSPTAGADVSDARPGLGIYRVTGEWSAGTITHNLRPAIDDGRLNPTMPAIEHDAELSVGLDPAGFADTSSISFELRYLQPDVTLQLERTGAATPTLVLTTEPTADRVEDQRPLATAELAIGNADQVDSSKQVFAHYFPPYPISIDNEPASSDYYTRQYLNPDGEDGKHAAYGGLLRDRPLPVESSTDPDWELRNLEREVRQAKAAGIDGFVVDLLSVSGRNWETSVKLMQAAENVGGFTVVPMVDATAPFSDLSPAAAADKLATLYRSPAAHRVGQDYLLSSFAAERKPVEWWRQVIAALQDRHHIPISFQAVFLNAGEQNLTAFAPIADGFGNWGVRTSEDAKAKRDYAAQAHRMGKTWMEPAAPQDVRPRSYLYAEALNTKAFRAMLFNAHITDADYIQLVTWNDYSEGTQVAPSRAHGSAFLSVVSYYATWFHTNKRPRLTTDTVVVTHRTQFTDAPVSHRGMSPSLGGADTSPRDAVEVLVFLTEPGRVTVTVGDQVTTYRAPAGVSYRTVPLHPGTVSATVAISGKPALTAKSSHTVVTSPEVQDLQYHAVAETR